MTARPTRSHERGLIHPIARKGRPMSTPSAEPQDLPGESGDRLDEVQDRIDSARDAAGRALTDRAEEDHRQSDLPADD